VFDVTCANCFTIPTADVVESPGNAGRFVPNAGWESFIIYDKIFPATGSAAATRSPSRSALATSTVLWESDLNFCANSGKTVTLPFIGSTTNIMTNEAGGLYGNNALCTITFNGAGNSQLFRVDFSSFVTETNADYLRIYNSAGTQIYINSGNITDEFSLYLFSPSIRFQFTSNAAGLRSGIFATVTLDVTSSSASPSHSPSSRGAIVSSGSMRVSSSVTASATASSTVFYKGNWTDLGQLNYAMSDIAPGNLGGLTISQCQMRCWLNSECTVIVVSSPCNTIALDSPQVNTVACGSCWLKFNYGWTISADGVSRSMFIYERMYPPTITATVSWNPTPSLVPSYSRISSLTSSRSAVPTSSVVMYSSINMCANNGGTVTLPFLNSSVQLYTNPVGTTYTDAANCNYYITGAGGSQSFLVTFQTFSTEECCDPFTIYEGSGRQVAQFRGTAGLGQSVFVSGSPMRVQFTTDNSVIGTGVYALFTLVYATSSGSASASKTGTVSAGVSASSLPSRSNTISPHASSSTSVSASVSVSSDGSSDFTISPYFTSSPVVSFRSSGSVNASVSTAMTPVNTRSLLSSSSGHSTAAETHSSRVTAAPSATVSVSAEGTGYTYSSTWSPMASSSESISSSVSESASVSGSSSISGCGSVSGNGTLSNTQSSSSRGTPTATSTQSAGVFKTGPPPPLPANLSALSPKQLTAVFESMSGYPPSAVTANLHKAGMAGLAAAGGSFSVSTEAFSLKMKSVGSDPNASIPLVAKGMDVAMPSVAGLYPNAAAGALIQWTYNPYSTSGNGTVLPPPDAPVISLSLVDSNGREIGVSNLSKPIVMTYNLKIIPGDPRFETPPSYLAECDKGRVYKYDGDNLIYLGGANKTGRRSWAMPCLLGTVWPLNCTEFTPGSVKTLVCPPATFTPKCQYWSNKLKDWSSDGCVATVGNATMIQCQCTHLTDFSSRMDAVAAENKAIFDNARNVYSLEGLIKYAQWYGVFGGIAAFTAVLGFISVWFDSLAIQKYVQTLTENKSIMHFLQHEPRYPIYIYNPRSTLNKLNRAREVRVNEKGAMSLCSRILHNHTRIAFLFKFDPRLSRLFRLLGIFVVQFHSLFITGLLYGFTYGKGVGDFAWYDSILLSLITTALNIPVLKLLIGQMNSIGVLEFKAQFPILYDEYQRRNEFEKYGLHYIHRGAGDEEESSSSGKSDNNIATDNDSEDFVTYLCLQLGCKKKPPPKVDISLLSPPEIMRHLVNIVREPYPYVNTFAPIWAKMPCHTWQGWAFLIICSGWVGWCLNYLLLFAAAHDSSVGTNVLTSYASSEIITVFFSQPVTILLTTFSYYVLNRYEHLLPEFLRKMLALNTNVRSIPSLYYFSDPWSNMAHTSFTSEFSYSLFVRCPAIVCGISEMSYAPIRAIATEFNNEREVSDMSEVTILYNRIWAVWDKIRKEKKESENPLVNAEDN